jgi:hypothetical protein
MAQHHNKGEDTATFLPVAQRKQNYI